MALDPLKIAIRGTTQEHLPIEDVVDGVVILKDGSCAMVVTVSSVNFDLLSEREQSALVLAYGGILNSLNFPIEIVIRSETKDVTSYLKNLSEAEAKQSNPLLKERIRLYRKFIEETVKKNDVLSKTFYVVVPFSIFELGIKTAAKSIPLPGGKGKTNGLPYPKEYILEKAMASLEPKRDHLMRLFARLGLEVKPLMTRELIELFYKTYNEESAANQKIQSLNYSAPMVTTKK
ncbi:hypothetical protein A3K55_00115 [Candidatus Shapirobacteria bacterium RBG_13_44_7]|uniref:TraC-like domain-containing protein n=1 Tax=Candidatus Shapirobacteria bacterium RBG_13_44_7 TaxID=1802149 RepID=A0A1F7SEL4_9BACT|nr:MAG: hypothetical protein A3K55_00115 [Candidatus Shapirobacteria bacterium RBG_13_44_7]